MILASDIFNHNEQLLLLCVLYIYLRRSFLPLKDKFALHFIVPLCMTLYDTLLEKQIDIVSFIR